jgi:ribonuclease D
VTHLAKIFPKMLQRLIKTGRGEWLDAEMEKLADPSNYAMIPPMRG